MTPDELAQAGFLPADWIPSGTTYTQGRLYVRMSEAGSVRVFIPQDESLTEISSGDLYAPQVHHRGPVHNLTEVLQRLEQSAAGASPAASAD